MKGISMNARPHASRPGGVSKLWLALLAIVPIGGLAATRSRGRPELPPVDRPPLIYEARTPIDSSGFALLARSVKPWPPEASLAQIADSWRHLGPHFIQNINSLIAEGRVDSKDEVSMLMNKAVLFNSEGSPIQAGKALDEARALLEKRDYEAVKSLYTVIYCQGITALRLGETENCIECRGESSCILPIAPSARHTRPYGSRRAIGYFTEYLRRFPDDLEVRWLLNVAHMTLGEYPDKVEPAYLVKLDRFLKSEFDLGKFRDVGHLVGVNRFNQAGGAIMEDFDDDGRLDLALTSFDPTLPMAFYHNRGDGTFEDRSESAGVIDQLGGLYCVQTDYNNDGRMDIYIPRGAWVLIPMRPTLLRNDGGTFTDVTREAGLLDPVTSNSATWADYDNDGWLDLFVCCEVQANRLYHNKGDGTFEEVAEKAGLVGASPLFCKGAAWFDFDNDGDPDLFLNNLRAAGQLFRNDGQGSFTEVTIPMGIDGPRHGFSCWAWDYDNDGWLDLFATCYDRTVGDVVKGMIGERHSMNSNRLFRNLGGKGFADVTKAAGLDMVFAAMGSNFADFDNDGYLDMYLATGEPSLGALVPNRMFRNVAGKRFAEITASSGTGHLQKGHAVACGDWDRDGDVDIFVETGGAVNGDKFHDVLFDNPGQGNHWLSVKLVGKKTNRAAIGARIEVVTAGDVPSTIRRHVSSGSSFGANPLRQHIGLAGAARVASLVVQWPTSGTTQVFRDIAADQAIEITEFDEGYRTLEGGPIPKPE
jgi:ASPIC and UnbV/FG-GAP-like repeat